ncbi:hypothetical protein Br6_05007 [Rhodococcus sp. Br-6]|nr:hypothetical protein Br6_05007 [Rhodococcus sp. Br-6]
MTGEGTRYKVTEIKVIRGTESRTITSKQQEGWELVTQEKSGLRTTMTFRRPKPKIPWRLWAAFGGVGVVLAGIMIVGAVLEDDSDASTTDAVAASSAEQSSSQPDPEQEAEPSSSADPTDKVLTVENNADLAALLHGPATGKAVEAFSEKYRSKTVEFKGFVADIYINPREHHGQSTINVMAGDANDPTHTGPVFQLSWYGHEDPKEKLAKGDNVRVRASVGIVYKFDPHQFYLLDEGANALEPR